MKVTLKMISILLFLFQLNCLYLAQLLEKPKKKKSRWGAETDDKSILAGLALTVPADLTKEQEQQLILQVQIEEISRRLRTGELGIPPNPEDRYKSNCFFTSI